MITKRKENILSPVSMSTELINRVYTVLDIGVASVENKENAYERTDSK